MYKIPGFRKLYCTYSSPQPRGDGQHLEQSEMGEERNEGNICQKRRLGSQGKTSVPVVRSFRVAGQCLLG